MRTTLSAHAAHTSAAVSLPADRDVDVVVVADTHGRPDPRAHSLIERLAPQVILHAGDIGDLSVLSELRALAPVLAVRGNIDEHAPALPDSMRIDLVSGERRPHRRPVPGSTGSESGHTPPPSAWRSSRTSSRTRLEPNEICISVTDAAGP